MLALKDITKTYKMGTEEVEALRGVSIQFRKNEFVSILGPSGCGKTTMLNIIGGLDQYTTGDLVINGQSTKHFKNRDWDTYRNHSVGFVFQSYHLIPHQTVLKNVELALTLSGVGKSERKQRAIEALNKVGLADQISKRPNQLSGGQMQRVAIARAIVNDPDIILADEPTGALDSKTSVQVMDILKEIAKEKLVIMVTHNPNLAKEYSNRIVEMLDGKLISDSNPYAKEEEQHAQREVDKKSRKNRKPSMSLWTSFGLSLRNLFSKKGRTTLTAFAGSIGIIGIALINAISQGMNTYINEVQEDALSSYPLTIEAETIDMSSLLSTFMGQNNEEEVTHAKDEIYQKNMFYDMVEAYNSIETQENDLFAFNEYLKAEVDKPESALHDSLTSIEYSYDLDMNIYTKNVDGSIRIADSQQLLTDLMREHFGIERQDFSNPSSMGALQLPMPSASMGGNSNLWDEIIPGLHGELVNPVVKKQYDLVFGNWPASYDDILLIVDENNEIDDMTLYALGLKPKEEIDSLAEAAVNKTEIKPTDSQWSYETIHDMDFRIVLNSDLFSLDDQTGFLNDLRNSETGINYLYDNALPLKVSGIVRKNEDSVSTVLNGSIAYTHALTEHVINEMQSAQSVQKQLDNPGVDVFNGLPFRENTGNLTETEKVVAFKDYLSKLNVEEKAENYVKIKSIPSQEVLDQMLAEQMQDVTDEQKKEQMIEAFTGQTGMPEADVKNYIDDLNEDEFEEYYTILLTEQIKMQYAASQQAALAEIPPEQLAEMLDSEMTEFSDENMAIYYDEVLVFSEATYADNLKKLGYIDLENPSAINLYANTFDSKDVIEKAIADYNEGVDELQQIKYVDYIGIMMSSITSIINAVTYVLIAFVAVSLIVSSIMIAVITLISVQERTKEIGILRAIGASKRNISNMFNVETVIIGFVAGLFGVVIAWLMTIPINIILEKLTNIPNLKAVLTLPVAIGLILMSMFLTLISGLIPAKSAAKKDPVEALRVE